MTDEDVAAVDRLPAWRHWCWQLGIAIDQLCNVLITPLQRGAWADETMSARAWRMDRAGKPGGRVLRPLIGAMFFWQRLPQGHYCRAYERELARVHLPPELRE